jgi:hypothetical protein
MRRWNSGGEERTDRVLAMWVNPITAATIALAIFILTSLPLTWVVVALKVGNKVVEKGVHKKKVLLISSLGVGRKEVFTGVSIHYAQRGLGFKMVICRRFDAGWWGSFGKSHLSCEFLTSLQSGHDIESR